MESTARAATTHTIVFGTGDSSGYASETSSIASTASRKRRHSQVARDVAVDLEIPREDGSRTMFGRIVGNIVSSFKRHLWAAEDDSEYENESGTSTEDEVEADVDEGRENTQTPPPNESSQRTGATLHVTGDDSASPAPQPGCPDTLTILVPPKTKEHSEQQQQLPSPLPSEDEKAPSPEPSKANTLPRSSGTRTSTVLPNSIFDTRKPFYADAPPTKKPRPNLNQTLKLRDKHTPGSGTSTFRTSSSRVLYPSGTPYKASPGSPSTPMGGIISRYGRTPATNSTVRPSGSRSVVARRADRLSVDRLRSVMGHPSVVKKTQKKSTPEIQRARDSVFRRKYDPLLAEIELQAFIKSQYPSSGLRTKQQVDKLLAERNELIQKLMREKAAANRFAVPPLKPAKRQRAQTLLQQAIRQQSHQFCSKYRIDITGHDLSKLRPGEWLNDNLIDFYINLITEREKAKGRKVEGMTTHFFTTFAKNGYKKVERWLSRKTKEYCRKNILNLDVLLVPINIGGSHWTLGVISPKKKQVEFWNSLKSKHSHGEDTKRYCGLLRSYVMQEAGVQSLDGWVDYSPDMQPQQNNFCDCGVFTVKTAEFRARDADPAYTPNDARNLRERMILEIIDGKMDPVTGEEGEEDDED